MTTAQTVTVKPSLKSGELWSKLLVQAAILFGHKVGLDLSEIDAETKLYLVTALEGLFQGGRPYVKRGAVMSGNSIA